MKRTETVVFTNMCMIHDHAGNVLVQDRRNPDWPGITFPGGHVEAGESFTAAAIREVQEETGLIVSDLQLCGIKDWVQKDGSRYMVLLYKTDRFCGEPVSSEEGEVWWMPLAQLPSMKLADGMEQMLRLFCEDRLTELFFYRENGQWVEVLQ